MIFVDTNVISESLRKGADDRVLRWLAVHDQELAIPTVTIAEIAYGIDRIRPDERSSLLAEGLDAWRRRFAGRIYPLTEQAALRYGGLMGRRAREGRPMSVPDGMIAAITEVNGGRLATRNTSDFEWLGIELLDPWTD